MSDLSKRISELSPEKRKLLMERLMKKNGEGNAHQKIQRQSRETNQFVLSFAQQRLWFLDQLETNTSTWNISFGFRMTGALDVRALHQTIDEIIRRHETLRTYFAISNGQPVQVISEHVTAELPVEDLSGLSNAEQKNEIQKRTAAEAKKPFDLSQSPMLRTNLLRLGDTEHVFILTMHHIVSDAWSLGVFFRELLSLYEAFSQGEPSPLPELPIQYADFAVWQREWLQNNVLDQQLSYWKEQLAGAPPVLELPTDRPRPAVQTFPGAYQSLAFSD